MLHPVLIRVILPGEWWWDFWDPGKPLASGGHDIIDTLGNSSLLGVFVDFPFPQPAPALGENPTLSWTVRHDVVPLLEGTFRGYMGGW
jgi:hypothetical protein